MEYIARWFIYFIIYAFLGYICEVIYVFLCTKKITNRGYLYGPLVPIYGFGALLIIYPLSHLTDYFILVFILGVLITTTLEYLVSLFMELIFHMRWWDYSDKLLNINGRVCLRNSSMFGVLVLFVIYAIHPITELLTDYLFKIEAIGYTFSILIFIACLIDSILSTIRHVGIAKIINNLNKIRESIKEKKNDIKPHELMNNFKEYVLNTKIVEKLNKLSIKHPSFRIRKKKDNISGNIEDVKKEIEDAINE